MHPTFSSTIEPHPASIVNVDDELDQTHDTLPPLPPTRQAAVKQELFPEPAHLEPPASRHQPSIIEESSSILPVLPALATGVLLGLIVTYAFSKQTTEL